MKRTQLRILEEAYDSRNWLKSVRFVIKMVYFPVTKPPYVRYRGKRIPVALVNHFWRYKI